MFFKPMTFYKNKVITKIAKIKVNTSYVVGQSAEGGIIAYILQVGDIGYDANFQGGLVATIADVTASRWGCWGSSLTGADGTAIGTGNQNTIDIMAGCAEANIAARVCGNLVEGGYDDWYLPSKDELNKLYINRATIGGFTANWYFSSSESTNQTAWTVYKPTGVWYSINKNDPQAIRAVRSF